MRTTVRYFLTDHLGSTVALADTSVAIVSSTSYDSFGNSTSDISTSYRYTGREYDSETGLYYYRNRWYDAETGRFISEDPIGFAGGDINLYGYVGNSPYGFIDPYGFWRCSPNDPPGWWDAVQVALDVAGLTPVVGLPADLLNAGISVARGNYADAALSMSAAIPLAGTVAGLAKIARSAKKVFKKVTKKLRRSPKFSKYEDVTRRSSIHNRETDVSMDDFVDSFMKAGYVPTLRGNGRVIELTKGNKKYTVRAFSSEGKPTAEVFVRGTRKMKIRLGQ